MRSLRLVEQEVARGGYSRVYQVRHKTNSRVYAMKRISKTRYDPQKILRYVRSEKQILAELHSPFLLSLKACFQTDKCFYLITPFAPLGDLSMFLQPKSGLPQEIVQQVSAEIVVALEHIHLAGFIYGDLKPENVLVDGEGHVLLADFGFSSAFTDCQQGFQSTDEFMAPEQLLGHSVDKAVDLWSLAI